MRSPRGLRSGAAWRGLLYGLLAASAIGAPLGLAALDTPLLRVSPSRSFAIFQLAGFTGALAALATAGLEIRGRRTWQAMLPILLPLLLGLHLLQRFGTWALRPWDYDVYEYAGRVVLQGGDPYRAGLGYLYPPLTAQVLAAAYRAAEWGQALLGLEPEPEAVWNDVFYLYQCSQLLLVLGAYGLCQRFARALGLPGLWAHGLSFALLIANDALFETLWNGQVNLWLLNLSLAGLLLARRAPALCGLALALGAHIKLYPLVLLWPLLVSGCKRAVLWTAAALVAVALLQTDLGSDWTPWRQFAQFFASAPFGQRSLHNNSFHSLLWNGIQLASGGAVRPSPMRMRGLGAAWAALLCGWLWLRTRARLRVEGAPLETPGAGQRLLLASGAETLAFGLLASPTVWPHEYVLALPLALLAAAVRGRDRPIAVAAGIVLMLGVPSAGIFPFSYRCAAGLLVLLVLTRPRAAPGRGSVRASGAARGYPMQPGSPDRTGEEASRDGAFGRAAGAGGETDSP